MKPNIERFLNLERMGDDIEKLGIEALEKVLSQINKDQINTLRKELEDKSGDSPEEFQDAYEVLKWLQTDAAASVAEGTKSIKRFNACEEARKARPRVETISPELFHEILSKLSNAIDLRNNNEKAKQRKYAS